MSAPSPPLDLLVAGAGLVGLTLALAVARESGGALAVAICDPALEGAPRPDDLRASAVSAGGRRMLERLGVWAGLAGDAQPITAMEITDSRGEDVLRPVFLTFDGEAEPGEPFAHMVGNTALLAALRQAAEGAGVRFMSAGVSSWTQGPAALDVTLSTGAALRTRLLAAADGGRSSVRERAGIPVFGRDYGRSALVLTAEHEEPHGGVAQEHFLPEGPFATLPLRGPDGAGRRSSIVWPELPERARRLAERPRGLLDEALDSRFGRRFGRARAIGAVRAYPLALGLARRFIAGRVALLGDAAHTIHPLAGQGLNLGLKDAAALAECVLDAARLGLDPGGRDPLALYDRRRRFDVAALAAATDGLARLFGADDAPSRAIRDLGLGLVDRMPGVKRALIRDAAGLEGGTPRLMRKA